MKGNARAVARVVELRPAHNRRAREQASAQVRAYEWRCALSVRVTMGRAYLESDTFWTTCAAFYREIGEPREAERCERTDDARRVAAMMSWLGAWVALRSCTGGPLVDWRQG